MCGVPAVGSDACWARPQNNATGPVACQDDGLVMSVDYWETRRKPVQHGLQLWIHAVPSKERHVVQDTLLEKVFQV